jgi:hypothetical protein
VIDDIEVGGTRAAAVRGTRLRIRLTELTMAVAAEQKNTCMVRDLLAIWTPS